MKIHKIKYSPKFQFYIGSNSKTSRFAKYGACKMAVISIREIKFPQD